jgi:hypothetical protein
MFLFVSYKGRDGEGKRRPIIAITDQDSQTARIYSVTSKYENKSEYIKRRYYEIQDLDLAGLDRKSWIDVGSLAVIDLEILSNAVQYGTLATIDIIGMNDLITQIINEF